MEQIGKTVMILAGLLFVVGLVLYFSVKIPFIGRLPGDIHIKKENFSFYFPLTTGILLSLLLTLILWLIRWFRDR